MAASAAALSHFQWKRRTGLYYPLRLSFSFMAYRRGNVIQSGVGQTFEISSTGIRVNLAEALSPEVTEIKLSIAWPAILDDGTNLQFVVQGRPASISAGSMEMEIAILSHEFKTAARRAANVKPRANNRA